MQNLVLNGQKVCKIQKVLLNFIQTQFQEGKTAAIIDGPWKLLHWKKQSKLWCRNDSTKRKTILPPLVVVKPGSRGCEKPDGFPLLWQVLINKKLCLTRPMKFLPNTEAQNAVSKNDELTTAVVDQFKKRLQPMPNISEMLFGTSCYYVWCWW